MAHKQLDTAINTANYPYVMNLISMKRAIACRPPRILIIGFVSIYFCIDDGEDDDVENFEEREGEITREDLLENQEEGTAAKEAKVYAAMSSLVNYVQAVR